MGLILTVRRLQKLEYVALSILHYCKEYLLGPVQNLLLKSRICVILYTSVHHMKLWGLWEFSGNFNGWPTTGAATTGQNKVTCLLLIASESECYICRGQMLQLAVALSLSSHVEMHPTVIICSHHFQPNSKLKHCVQTWWAGPYWRSQRRNEVRSKIKY